MTHQKNRTNRNGTSALHATQPKLCLSAAMMALLAGTPAGLAQNAENNTAPSGALGSLKSFLSSGSQSQAADSQVTPPADDDSFRTDGVYYDEDKTIEMHVQDEDLVNVLQMLSIQSERNIIASNDVSARVTANLYGVTFHEALDAILHVNGYGYIERGNFIYVYPIEVLDQIEQASREKVAEVIHLNFLSAVDAADFVSDLLSDEGSIKSNGKVADWTEPSSPVGNENFANESTLVVYDYPENIEAIKSLLNQLDTRPAQILVEATIVQTAINENNAFGVDFSIISDLNFSEFASPLGVFDGLRKGGTADSPLPADGGGTVATSSAGGTAGPGTFKAGVLTNDVAVFLKALDEVTDTTVISNPKVVTLNRQPGRVLVGRKVGYLQTTATQTSTTQTVEFLDTGTQLNFRPFVTSEGLIRMELLPRVSDATLRSATDATGAAVTIPDENTNELSANVLVPDGHTIVLGGLFREATTATRRQVPVLGDIPIIGAAFQGHEDQVDRQEIIFLITPSIVSDQVLVDQGEKADGKVHQVRAGAREGLLPFSRERQAAQLLVEAEHLARDGKTDEALHKIRRSLKLNTHQPQAIALREKLVNEKDVWPSNSLLDQIVNDNAEDALEHNILQNGWWGATSKVENTKKSSKNDAYASKNASKKGSSARKASSHASKATGKQAIKRKTPAFASKHHTGNTSADADNGQTPFTFNSTVINETPTYTSNANAVAVTPEGEWWNSPEFQAFMVTYNWAVAQENGQPQVDPTNEWWNSPEFQAFVTTFGWMSSNEKDAGSLPDASSNAKTGSHKVGAMKSQSTTDLTAQTDAIETATVSTTSEIFNTPDAVEQDNESAQADQGAFDWSYYNQEVESAYNDQFADESTGEMSDDAFASDQGYGADSMTDSTSSDMDSTLASESDLDDSMFSSDVVDVTDLDENSTLDDYLAYLKSHENQESSDNTDSQAYSQVDDEN